LHLDYLDQLSNLHTSLFSLPLTATKKEFALISVKFYCPFLKWKLPKQIIAQDVDCRKMEIISVNIAVMTLANTTKSAPK
jgi:hypothetical protein